jgi:hypothetical protein
MENSNKLVIVKKLYLYLVSFATLMMMLISGVNIVSTILKMTVFTEADNYTNTPYVPGCEGVVDLSVYSDKTPLPRTMTTSSANETYCRGQLEQAKKQQEHSRWVSRESSLVWSTSLLAVALPLFIFHWRSARKEN